MGRWAYGDEIACTNGRCRNLAEWIIHGAYGRNWPVCWLHLSSASQMVKQRDRWVFGKHARFEILPFQDASVTPVRKRKRRRAG